MDRELHYVRITRVSGRALGETTVKTALLRAASYLGALVLLTLVSFWRIPPTALDVVWAEDGAVFLTDAVTPGQPFAPMAPYAGYLHFVPRVAAEVVVRFFALEDYAIALTVLACAAVAGVSLMTYHCAQALTSNQWIRMAWAAIPVFVNVGAIETLGNFANIHWYFLWLTPWLLIKPAKSKVDGALLFVVALLVSLTEIISIVFVPLFLFGLRDKRYWAARAGLGLGLAAQAYATLNHPRTGDVSYQLDPWSAFYGWVLNTAGPIVYGTPASIVQLIENFGAARDDHRGLHHPRRARNRAGSGFQTGQVAGGPLRVLVRHRVGCLRGVQPGQVSGLRHVHGLRLAGVLCVRAVLGGADDVCPRHGAVARLGTGTVRAGRSHSSARGLLAAPGVHVLPALDVEE